MASPDEPMRGPLEPLPETRRARVAYRAVLLAALLVIGGFLFREILTFLLAIVLTIILALPLIAFADFLERFRVPRIAGVLLGFVLALAVLAGVVWLVVPRLVAQGSEFVEEVPDIVASLGERLEGLTGIEAATIAERAQAAATGVVDAALVAELGLGLVSGLALALVIVVTALYVAIDPKPLSQGLLRLFPPERRPWAADVMAKVRDAWLGWLRGTAVDMVAVGLLLYLGLRIVGLELAIFFAVLGALLEVVPYIGPIVASLPAIAFGLADSLELGLLVLVVFLAVNQLEGNLLVPVIMSQAVKLHPAVIAIGVVIVGSLFGIIGLLIAVPILAAFLIVVEEAWIKPREAAADAGGDDRDPDPSDARGDR